jgi:D-alanyl-lipoteichoic acid acyltransferase DltB (MBOAT superfamily)
MLFNSIEYVIFFPIVICLYFFCPPRLRWVLLLAASYIFYMAWEPAYVLLIITSTIVDYVAAQLMDRTAAQAKRRRYLLLSLVCNLGLLFTFKYFNFFSDSIRVYAQFMGLTYDVPTLRVLLPVGISFYTFQTLGYTIEVYRRRQKPEKHLGRFALYVAFFPQLVAGPIERSHNLLPQLRQTHRFDYDNAVEGMRLILWGMFKKVVVADRLAIIVDRIYDTPAKCPGPLLVLGTICFAYQIYCDFSGYSDIAVGCARMMGVRLMINFNRPYHARSIAEFWHRWHISLSTWFRDYVYIPLGGRYVTTSRWYVNLIIVFGLSGLWHGANWTFLIWGLFHAGCYIASRLTKNARERLAQMTGWARLPRMRSTVQALVTFTVVCVGWVFFRAESVAEAATIFANMPNRWALLLDFGLLTGRSPLVMIRSSDLALTTAILTFFILVEWLLRERPMDQVLGAAPFWLRWMTYLALGMAVINLGVTKEIPFVYFQF